MCYVHVETHVCYLFCLRRPGVSRPQSANLCVAILQISNRANVHEEVLKPPKSYINSKASSAMVPEPISTNTSLKLNDAPRSQFIDKSLPICLPPPAVKPAIKLPRLIELEKKEDTSVLLLNKLNHLLNNVPDFIMCNKTLTDMTTSFIRICNNDSIDTSSLNEDVVNSMLISWIENQI